MKRPALIGKTAIKNILGKIPLTAEAYWYIRTPGKPLNAEFSLRRLEKLLPEWRRQAESALRERRGEVAPKKLIFLFGTLRYWIEHAALLSTALAGQGHTVTFSYLPYARWQRPLDRFNLRRHNIYAHNVLKQLEPLVQIHPLLPIGAAPAPAHLPAALDEAVRLVALRDTQYTLQVEEVSQDSDLYRLRLERNLEAAQAALAWLEKQRPDLIVLPNGTILEFGVLYQVARYLNIPVVTYEFGEQRSRIWIAQNAEVMRQETDALWQARQDQPLSNEQMAQVRTLFTARQRASLWENFARRWQGVPSTGGEKVRQALSLDGRPVVLLATNVIGDSLTLGRQVFSDSMTDWLKRTVQFFAGRPDVQFVIRIHPGELITKGPSVAGVVNQVLPNLPEHIHLVEADAQVNTYDIVEIADLGLVYTTTVGMEMAMSGVPVIVVGNTHYRGKGFTLDPASWDDYFKTLEQVLAAPDDYRLEQPQVERAWHYAYRFFFDYPHPFPWHLLHIWKDLEEWPIQRLLSAEGQQTFGATFHYLAGEPITW